MESAPPPDQPPPMWELKLGQYVDRRLNLREMRSLVDGWASKPAFPKGYSGPAWTYAYLEPVEGAWVAGRARGQPQRPGSSPAVLPGRRRRRPAGSLARTAGAAAAVAPDAMAYPHRGVGFDVVTDTFFLSSPGAKDAAQAWLNGLYDRRCVGRGQWGARMRCSAPAGMHPAAVALRPPPMRLQLEGDPQRPCLRCAGRRNRPWVGRAPLWACGSSEEHTTGGRAALPQTHHRHPLPAAQATTPRTRTARAPLKCTGAATCAAWWS